MLPHVKVLRALQVEDVCGESWYVYLTARQPARPLALHCICSKHKPRFCTMNLDAEEEKKREDCFYDDLEKMLSCCIACDFSIRLQLRLAEWISFTLLQELRAGPGRA